MMRWRRQGLVDDLRELRRELREVTAERDALRERFDECGKWLGTIIVAGSLAPGESLADPPEHAAVDAMLGVVAERDAAAERADDLHTTRQRARAESAEADRDRWRTAASGMGAAYTRLNATLRGANTDRDKLRERVTELEAEIARIPGIEDNWQQMVNEEREINEAARVERDKLRERVEELEAELAKLRAETVPYHLDDPLTVAARLHGQAADGRVAELEAELADVTERRNHYKTKCDTVSDNCWQLQADLAKLRAQPTITVPVIPIDPDAEAAVDAAMRRAEGQARTTKAVALTRGDQPAGEVPECVARWQELQDGQPEIDSDEHDRVKQGVLDWADNLAAPVLPGPERAVDCMHYPCSAGDDCNNCPADHSHPPAIPPGCAVDPLSSRTCERGTNSCVVEHDREGAVVLCDRAGDAEVLGELSDQHASSNPYYRAIARAHVGSLASEPALVLAADGDCEVLRPEVYKTMGDDETHLFWAAFERSVVCSLEPALELVRLEKRWRGLEATHRDLMQTAGDGAAMQHDGIADGYRNAADDMKQTLAALPELREKAGVGE